MSGSKEQNGQPPEGESSEAGQAAAVEQTEGQAPAGQEAGGASAEPPASASPPAWFTKRIDGLTARLREEERQHAATKQSLTLVKTAHDALVRELAALRANPANGAQQQAGAGPQGQPTTTGAPAGLSQDEIDALVEQRAAERLQQQASISAENESALRGKAVYQDFEQTVGNLRQLGGLKPEVFRMALDTGHAEHILYAMGKNLDLASEIMEMPPGKMALEMAKLAQKPGPKPVDASKAPTPMTTVNGRAGGPAKDLADPKLSMEDWERQRNQQIKERKEAGRR